MADSLPFRAPEPEFAAATSLAENDVGHAKGILAFSPRWDRLAIVAAAGFQVFILVAMIFGHTVPFLGASTVLLKVEPVDPRDLLSGDYVTLSYAFSRLPGGKFQMGQEVYVTLVPEADGRHYRAGEFLHEQPESGVFIRGTAQGFGGATYGIESYYVQEGKGHDYENAVRERRLWAEVAIEKGGNALLRGLLIE